MALLSRELQWAGCCYLESSNHHLESLIARRRRVTAVRDLASNLRFDSGTSLSGGNWGERFEIASRGRRCRNRRRNIGVCYAAQKSLYETLGVSPTATEKELKRAYRGLALKFHPDVNKQPGAQEKFLEIKSAYQTLVDSKSRSKYDAASSRSARSDDWDPFQWGSSTSSKRKQEKEEFYGLDDFFKDLQSDLQKRSASRSAKPKSLWEELADVGEEFVEFLEKELNISDGDGEKGNKSYTTSAKSRSQDTREQSSNPKQNNSGTKAPRSEEPNRKIENDLDDIEDMLAKLKKEMGR